MRLASKKPRLSNLAEYERNYLLGMLDLFENGILIRHKNLKSKTRYRYTPIQMLKNTLAYFRVSIENGQPLTISGIAVFNGMKRDDFYNHIYHNKNRDPAFDFLDECVDFVEMYIEYTGQKKQNPAFQIFWLKNRGWKDKIEIEASTNQAALTEDERESAQKRLAAFSEVVENRG
jgi:hypothetical protein